MKSMKYKIFYLIMDFHKFQYNNPIHKGILLNLLVIQKNNILSPFFPLQYYPQQQKEVEQITNILEKQIIEILEKTKIPLTQSGKGKRTRRRKHYSKKTLSKKGVKVERKWYT